MGIFSRKASTAQEFDAKRIVHRRVEITVEREVVSMPNGVTEDCIAFCKECCADSTMLTPENAASIARATSRTIHGWIDEKKLHFIESATGKVLVCSRSLQNHVSGHAPRALTIESSGESK
jgi:hypothetical protein